MKSGKEVILFILYVCFLYVGRVYSWSSQPPRISKGFKLITLMRTITGVAFLGTLPCSQSPIPAFAVVKDENYGVVDGRLMKCNRRSNCVSTSSIDQFEKYSRPWAFAGSSDMIFKRLKEVVKGEKYLHLMEYDDETRYLRAEAKSAVPPGGVDDVEFLVKDTDKIITFRSNSRQLVSLGDEILTDGGSNLNRLKSIQRQLGVSDMNPNNEVDEYFKEVKKRNIFQVLLKSSEPSDVNFLH